MGQESSSSRHSEDAILAKYYSQLNPRKEPFAEKYELINTVLGEGITGKVYKCKLKRNPNSEIFALKASHIPISKSWINEFKNPFQSFSGVTKSW